MTVFETLTGQIRVNTDLCLGCQPKPCAAACPEGILRLENGTPALAKPADSVQRGGCRECLACEIACAMGGARGLLLRLPIEGLNP